MRHIHTDRFTVEDLPDGARFILPRRNPSGGSKTAAKVVVGISGMVVLGGAASVVWGVRQLLTQAGLSGAIGPLMLGLPVAAIAGFILFFGLLVLRGWSEVEITSGTLRAIERGSWRKWVRSRPVDGLEAFEIVDALNKGLSGEPATNLTPERSAIIAKFKKAQPLIIAPGYHRDLLTELAAHLARRCDLATPDRLFDEDEPKIEIRQSSQPVITLHTGAESAQQEVTEKPESSDAALDHTPDGLTITIPPAGLRKGGKGLFGFGVIWSAGTLAVTIIFLAKNGLSKDLIVLPFLFTFLSVGAGMILGGLNMGRRRTVIDVVADTLLINRESIFGLSSRQWPAHDVVSIMVGPSGMEVNDRPIMELQVHYRAEKENIKKFGLLSERTPDEQAWIASTLRAALGVSSEAPRRIDALRAKRSAIAASKAHDKEPARLT